MEPWGDRLDRLSVLGEPLRRSLYSFVVRQSDAVSREQASTALQVPLHTVRFHLDQLAKAGLLQVEFRRLSGRRGPGAGRPTKLYRRSSEPVSMSLPERRYDVVGHMLAHAVERSLSEKADISHVLSQVAHQTGRALAEANASKAPPGHSSPAGPLDTAAQILESHGYEPAVDDGEVHLRNCPFEQLAADHTNLVCGMNRDLIEGLLEGAHLDHLEARLTPHPTWCCVRVQAHSNSG